MEKTCLAFVLFLLPAVAMADCPGDPDCAPQTVWDDATVAIVRLDSPTAPGYERWQIAANRKTGDTLVKIDAKGPRDAVSASIGIVGGLVTITKGIETGGNEVPTTTIAALLWFREVTAILGAAFPEGPAGVHASTPFDYESKARVKLFVPGASKYIPAPWRAKGELRPLQTGDVAFDIRITTPPRSASDGKQSVLHLSGELGAPDVEVFNDKDSLEGWTVPDKGLKTVGDIRATIAAARSAQAPAK
ncbi:MAG TPA: hypothetical protein VN598_00255 [Usitatibacter sp.]|nr:hypothetical protein [Usitatibacter sp.]